ncbi:hypothetical protein CesoFtcFv8_019247 [Champsocephalus esox]|uniref:Deoxyribonuclease n=1 Tax=Champsocephalus esox TaxID=159716 RepID=A0AAN8GPF8_9TELE|nr:hypothetical protein CesoFtcFv8_019247 [Champsocephalus esox]
MRLLWALGLFSALLHVTSCLWIGAFNIQCFGPKKSGIKDPKNKYEEARDIIKKIVLRYDIIVIQEVLDPDGKVTNRLKDLVNNGYDQFKHRVSNPLGPANHKERYLFLYRKDKVSEKGSFQYDVKGFDRPPFVVQFSSTHTGVDFVLIPIHTKPDHAVEEIDALVDVVEAAEQRWKNNNIMVLGDFNAGVRYVGIDAWRDIRLLTEKGFHSLINDGVATTLAETTIQTHDRIVVSDEMKKGVVAGTAKVFDFKKEYGLGDQAKKISDHFPVEVELKLKL